MKRKSIKELSADAVDVKPRDFDFSGEGLSETWEIVYPDVSDWTQAQCKAWLERRGHELPEDANDNAWQSHTQDRMAEDEAFAPMMNYIYALPDFGRHQHSTAAAQEAVENTACVVVLIRDGHDTYPKTPFLALAGGGMDLSWDICAAYMQLGYLPPVHFCRLPEYAGKKLTSKARWIIAGCKRSCQVSKRWADSRLRDLRHVRKALAGN